MAEIVIRISTDRFLGSVGQEVPGIQVAQPTPRIAGESDLMAIAPVREMLGAEVCSKWPP